MFNILKQCLKEIHLYHIYVVLNSVMSHIIIFREFHSPYVCNKSVYRVGGLSDTYGFKKIPGESIVSGILRMPF